MPGPSAPPGGRARSRASPWPHRWPASRARRRRPPRAAARALASPSRIEPIADAPDRDQAAGLRGVHLDLLAEPADVDGDGGRVAVPGEIPHLLEELGAGERDAGTRGHHSQQVELLARELHRVSLLAYLPAGAVDLQVAVAKDGGRGGRGWAGPPEDGTGPGHDLARREGLRDVVIGAELQADDAVGLLALGREHDDRRLRLCPDPPKDLQAIDPREHEIQQDEVGSAGRERLE